MRALKGAQVGKLWEEGKLMWIEPSGYYIS